MCMHLQGEEKKTKKKANSRTQICNQPTRAGGILIMVKMRIFVEYFKMYIVFFSDSTIKSLKDNQRKPTQIVSNYS